MKNQTVTAECDHCGRVHRVDRDEDGYGVLHTVPCQGSDDCRERLCSDCARKCFNCGLLACEEHSAYVQGDLWCFLCLEERARNERQAA